MPHRSTTRLSATVLLAAGLLAPAVARAQDPVRPPAPPASTSPTKAPSTAAGSLAPSLASACTVTLNGDSLRVGANAIAVQASLSSSIGDSVTATFPADSKIDVVNVSPVGAMNTLRLTLNTSAATPGTYTIALKGSKGECTGKVKIAANP